MPDAVNEIGASRAPRAADGGTPPRRVEQLLAGWLPPEEAVDDEAAAVHQGELVGPVQRINEVMRPYGVEFELRETTTRVVTRLVDRDTGELIRQIPAEEVMRIAEHLEELQGSLIDLEA
ncbi:flagellar protein FlaG [Halomonas sp. THAF12]|uniref:flagellar protein FlaG n=1 Tax=Halomonas sp. THAF12 TaxID=2587849 RepID=UPI001268A58C|nr:flagellar protein FlaG [Halomonas sp. THAF12]QFT86630.1 flagellar protein FlaG [Halomonas sp. THAF12]